MDFKLEYCVLGSIKERKKMLRKIIFFIFGFVIENTKKKKSNIIKIFRG